MGFILRLNLASTGMQKDIKNTHCSINRYSFFMNGLIIQWGTCTSPNYQGAGLTLTFALSMSSINYAYTIFGGDAKFRSSTEETASQQWTRRTGSLYYSRRERDFPEYKEVSWIVIGV